MKIKLIKNVYGEDRHGNKFIRSTVRFSRGVAFEWRVGVEMEVSEASGQKMIDAGDAAEVKSSAAA